MTFQNIPLQNGVDFYGSEIPGAFLTSVPHNIDTFNFGSTLPDNAILPYGTAVVYDSLPDGGVKIPVALQTVVADIAGFIPYKNGGIMEDGGFKKGGLYTSVPVLNFGRIFVPVTAGKTLRVGDIPFLNLTPGSNFNTITDQSPLPSSFEINLSFIASVAEDSRNGVVALTIKQYLK